MAKKYPVNKEKQIEGAIESFSMAGRHLKAAKLLEDINEFSIANSLLILSVEEGLKSFILFSLARGTEFVGLDLEKFFTNHSSRHIFSRKIFLTIQGLNVLQE